MYNKKSQRQLKVAEQIKRVIADLFLRDGNLHLADVHITINEVDISPDMKNAKVFISIFGEVDKIKLIKELNAANSYLRSKLASEISMRYTPNLTFIIDETSDNVARIEELISEKTNNN